MSSSVATETTAVAVIPLVRADEASNAQFTGLALDTQRVVEIDRLRRGLRPLCGSHGLTGVSTSLDVRSGAWLVRDTTLGNTGATALCVSTLERLADQQPVIAPSGVLLHVHPDGDFGVECAHSGATLERERVGMDPFLDVLGDLTALNKRLSA